MFFILSAMLQYLVQCRAIECIHSEAKMANYLKSENFFIYLLKPFVFFFFFFCFFFIFKMVIRATRLRITFSRYSGKINMKLQISQLKKMLMVFFLLVKSSGNGRTCNKLICLIFRNLLQQKIDSQQNCSTQHKLMLQYLDERLC